MSENNIGFVRNSSIIAPFNYKPCYADFLEPRAAVLATRGVGTDLSENNTAFVHNLSIMVPFDYNFRYADVTPGIF